MFRDLSGARQQFITDLVAAESSPQPSCAAEYSSTRAK